MIISMRLWFVYTCTVFWQLKLKVQWMEGNLSLLYQLDKTSEISSFSMNST